MANKRIDQLTDGGAALSDDIIPVYRATSGLVAVKATLGSVAGSPTYTTTATAAGTTTLTAASSILQYFTGTTTQTVVLPVVSTLALGKHYTIVNNSTDAVTVQSSGANTIQVMAPNSKVELTVIAITGTGTSSWDFQYEPMQATGIIGTTTNDAAALGRVGQSQSNSNFGSPVALTTATAANVCSLSLTPGNYLLLGSVRLGGNAATNLTYAYSGITITSADPDTSTAYGSVSYGTSGLLAFASGYDVTIPISPLEAKVASTTTYYLPVKAFFTINSCNAVGRLYAIRIR